MRLILDGNNLAWAGYYALERAMQPEDDERRRRVALLGIAGSVLGTIARVGEPPGVEAPEALAGVSIAFDEGRPLRRRQIFPEYQRGRERDPKFVANEPTILAAIAEMTEIALASMPVEITRGTNVEADDLIAGRVARRGRERVRIVSTDRDFLQLIEPGVSVYAPVKKLVIDDGNFDECAMPKASDGKVVGFPRARFLQYRALVGDNSDDLPGVPGMGPLSAAKLVALADVDTYFGMPDAVRAALGRKSAAVENAFADGLARDVVLRNRALMDLRAPSPVWPNIDAMTKRGTWDAARLGAWLDGLATQAIDRAALMGRLEALAAITR